MTSPSPRSQEAMRNAALQQLEPLVGTWSLTLSDAWFLDPGTEVHGTATVEWLGDAFLVMRSELGGDPAWDLVIGRSDARGEDVLLYHDERGVSRVFRSALEQGRWTWWREDPDFFQRFVGDVGPDRIAGRTEASEDQGRTWRKDFDLDFRRVPPAG